MNKKECMILTELKAIQASLPANLQAGFAQILDELGQELDKKSVAFRFDGKTFILLILTMNFIVFPVVNFVASWISPDAPQIHFDLERIVKVILPIFGGV